MCTPLSFANISVGKDGLIYRSERADIEVSAGGRLHLDSIQSDRDLFQDELEIRRMRADVTTKIGKAWRVKADYEFAPDRSGWRNVWVEYWQKNVRVKAGQFISPLSIEDLMQSNDLTFTEKSLASAALPGFRKGVSANYQGKKYSVTGAVMTNPIEDSSRRDDGRSVILRGVYNPVKRKDEIIHLAVSTELRDLKSDGFSDTQSASEVSLRDRRLLASKRLDDASKYRTINAEAALIKGPVLLQTQYLRRRTHTPNRDFDTQGGYVQASYLIGDARRGYSSSSGAIGKVRPKSKKGAWEVSARASQVSIEGAGTETALSTGVSWYINHNLRLTNTLTHTQVDSNDVMRNVDGITLQSRIQIAF